MLEAKLSGRIHFAGGFGAASQGRRPFSPALTRCPKTTGNLSMRPLNFASSVA